MTNEQKKILEELGRSGFGKVLRVYLKEELDNIDDISSCKTLKEMEGRQYGIKLVRKLFSFMEEQKTTEKGKNQYE